MVTSQHALINEEDIKMLLKQHQNTTTTLPKTNLLLYLSIVDDFILEANQTIGDEAREYAINTIVIDIITQEYHKQCDVLAIPDEQREDVHQMLEYVRQGGRKFALLASLIILYFIHARPDSNLSYDELPTLILNSSRNIIRIRTLGIKIIRDCLIEYEIASRRRYLERRLRQSLPNRGYIDVVEREKELETLKNIISESKNTLILGVSGVGKSSLIEKVVDYFIAHIQVESVILWLDMRKNTDLEASIRSYFPKISFDVLKHYLAQINTLIIIDYPTPDDIHYLDIHFPLAKIVAISEKILHEPHFWHHVYHLKPLNAVHSERFIRHILNRYPDVVLNDNIISNIVKSSQGIPKHIIASVANYCSDYVESSSMIDCYLALTKHTWLDVYSLVDFWSPDVTLETILDHPNVESVMIEGKSYARLRDHVFVQFDENLTENIYRSIYRNSLLNSPIFPDVIYGLMQHNLAFDDGWLRYVLDHYSDKVDSWTTWLESALAQTDDLSVYSDVAVRLSRYSRWIGQPDKYLNVLEKIKTQSAQLEIVHCLRMSGRYVLAFQHLEKLIASKRASAVKQNELLLLKAQLYMDVQNFEQAEQLLRQIEPSEDQAYHFAQAELTTLMGSHVAIDDIYRDYETGDHMMDSYYHYLIASQNYVDNPKTSLQYFLKGLQIINRQPVANKLIVGRYLSNIGACYVRLGHSHEARTYLQEALNIQRLIGDKLGILYTEKSLSELKP